MFNQCAETCIKDVALVGTSKGWRLLVGGNGGGKPRLARELAKELTTEQALELIDKIIHYYQAHAKPHQRLGAWLDKIDFEQFQSAITES